MRSLKVATYNVHRCIGDDGRYDADRVGEVLREIDADVVGLQEVDIGHSPSGQCQSIYLAQKLGVRSVEGPVITRGAGAYGNALLTKGEIARVRQYDLSVPSREPRGALDVEVRFGDAVLRCVVVHLGLMLAERRRQVEQLVAELRPLGAGMTLLFGDLNEWAPGSGIVARLDLLFGRAKHRRTFPTRLAVLPLDRIWVHPRRALVDTWVHKTPLSRHASDHYPVVSELLAAW